MQKADRANPSRLAPPNVTDGVVEYMRIPYAIANPTTEAATELICLGILPAGAIPRPDLSFVVCGTDPGTALTVDVGTVGNPDGWGDGIAMTAAGKVEFCAAAHTAPAWLVPTPLVADEGSGNATINATVMTGTALTADAIVYFVLAYQRNK